MGFTKAADGAWEEVKKVAREHLESCGGPGSKILKTASLTYSQRTGVKYLEPEEEFRI